MATTGITGKDKARRAALSSIEKLERRFAQNLNVLVDEIDNHIKALTPVNTGETVRNYIWSVGSPSSLAYDPIDNGPPGPTNSMALGTEPRRAVNEAAAAESITSLNLLANPFETIYLTNNSPDIQGLELGILPGPPLKSRSPQGMFGVTQSYITTLVKARGMFR